MKGYIYALLNYKTEKMYIGSTNNIKRRISKHFSTLKGNKHSNMYLQNAYNKYGLESFKTEVLEELAETTPKLLLEVEQVYLDNLKPEYNIAKHTGGGDNLCNHPNREAIRKRQGETYKDNYAALPQEEKDRRSEAKKQAYAELPQKEKDKQATNKRRSYAKLPQEEKYRRNKESSKKAKAFWESLSAEERKRNKPRGREVFVLDTVYISMSEASRALKIPKTTLSRRLKSEADTWEDYFYCDEFT